MGDIREGDVIYDDQAWIVTDINGYPFIKTEDEHGRRTRTFYVGDLWSPETGVNHPKD